MPENNVGCRCGICPDAYSHGFNRKNTHIHSLSYQHTTKHIACFILFYVLFNLSATGRPPIGCRGKHIVFSEPVGPPAGARCNDTVFAPKPSLGYSSKTSKMCLFYYLWRQWFLLQ